MCIWWRIVWRLGWLGGVSFWFGRRYDEEIRSWRLGWLYWLWCVWKLSIVIGLWIGGGVRNCWILLGILWSSGLLIILRNWLCLSNWLWLCYWLCLGCGLCLGYLWYLCVLRYLRVLLLLWIGIRILLIWDGILNLISCCWSYGISWWSVVVCWYVVGCIDVWVGFWVSLVDCRYKGKK